MKAEFLDEITFPNIGEFFAFFDKKVSAKLQELGYEGISAMTESEIERFLLLNSDISDKEKLKIKCVKDNILQVYEIKQLEDLKLAREIINSGYYNHFEIACECVKNGNYKNLFELLIDLDCQDSAKKLLITPNAERVDIAYNLFRFFRS